MKRFKWLLPWLAGAVAATLLFAALLAVGNIRYENSDDILLVKGFLGFEGGKPINMTQFLHTVLNWTFYGLSLLVPGIPWFSVVQLFFLWLSVAVIVKCAIQLGGWRGVAGAALYLVMFAAFACGRINYTASAAFMGGAAVMQLMTLEQAQNGRDFVLRAWLAVLLAVMTYLFRQVTVLPVLAYCLLALAWMGIRKWADKQRVKRVAVLALVLCSVLLALVGVEKAEIVLRGEVETLDWQDQRTALFDFSIFQENMEPALAADSGLTEKQIRLLQHWYFWDASIDNETLATLAKAYQEAPKPGVLENLTGFFRTELRYRCAAAFLLLLCAWVLLCDEKTRWSSLAAICAILGGMVLLLYLCWSGRILARGVDSIFFSCGTLLLALALRCKAPRRKALAIVLCAAMLWVVAEDVTYTLDILDENQDWVSMQRENELETFALKHPDKLIVRSPSLLRDTRIFPDVSAGIPANTAIWGDWYCRMPGWRQQMAAFGLDGSTFTLADWTSDVLLFATNESAPPRVLTDAVSEALGRDVQIVPYGEEGSLFFYQMK